MIARLFWLALLAAIAAMTTGLQLDRQARKSPALAQTVPEPFRSSAQLPIAAFAQSGDNPELALAETEKLVMRRPLPAEHLRALAQAQFAAGKLDESALTIQYAAQRGWRDPLAQEAMLRLALEAGDMDEAARRFAALFLRRDTADSLIEELGPIVLSEPGGEGRRTLIDIVAGGQRWHNQFLRRGARSLPPDAFAEIVVATADAGVRYDCRVLTQAERVLKNRDATAASAVAGVIRNQC